MNTYRFYGLILAFLMMVTHGSAKAADEALLQVLLDNKLITQAQFDALVKTETSTENQQSEKRSA